MIAHAKSNMPYFFFVYILKIVLYFFKQLAYIGFKVY